MGAPPRRISGIALTLAVALPLSGRAQDSFHTGHAHLTVQVDATGLAMVQAEFVPSAAADLPAFQYRRTSCTTVDSVVITLNGTAVPFSQSEAGPFVRLAPQERASPGDVVVVTHRVTLSRAVTSVPVVLPAVSLTSAAEVTLRMAGREGRPVLPHLPRGDGPGTWTATLAALPAAVRVDLGRAPSAAVAACAAPAWTGDSGTFETRLAVFVATLVLWIPLYFWWAHRQPDRG
ncbi:MAG TPA: hypothetical protein VD793_04100 [Gemmatimonadales bacterium]|nr:hypothetical protein [Gemmatimonadales bacterium]